MVKVIRTVHINSTPEKVVEYIADVNHHPAFLSALKSVENVSGDPKDTSTTWDWSFVMAGVEFRGKSQTVDYQAGKHFSFKTFDGADSVFSYKAETEGEGTLLTVEVDYEIPDSVMSKVANQSVIERYNEAEADRIGENLRAILEN